MFYTSGIASILSNSYQNLLEEVRSVVELVAEVLEGDESGDERSGFSLFFSDLLHLLVSQVSQSVLLVDFFLCDVLLFFSFHYK